MVLSKFEPVALIAVQASALRVGVLSDMHVNLKYDPLYSHQDGNNCWASGDLADKPSPWARYGCDPSAELVDAMLQHFVEVFGTPDILLINGDNLAHHVDVNRGEGSES